MMASTSLRMSVTLGCTTSSKKEPFFIPHSANSLTIRQSRSRATTITVSSRRRRKSDPTSKKKLPQKNVEAGNDIDEDAFEALFHQLEEDLKNDGLNVNDGEDDEISEEELAKLERELSEALDDDELLAAFESIAAGEIGDEVDEEDDAIEDGGDEVHDEDEEEEMPVKLKNWQLKRLAYALRNGRRKTRIKDLAAELCLDRAEVLKLLRDPPPSLVMMSAALPDKPVSKILDPVEKPIKTVPLEMVPDAASAEVETKVPDAASAGVEMKVPVHVMQSNWSARKRLKKVQVETLEQVYRRTKRPTNAMISSIVHVTNLPRKKVVKWFEDKRTEDGVPENRVPYQKPAVLTS